MNTTTIPESAVQEFIDLIGRVATQGDLQEYLEHFKGYYCAANGTTHIWSTNSSWAQTDLSSALTAAAGNPPLFLEAFFEKPQRFLNGLAPASAVEQFLGPAERYPCTAIAHSKTRSRVVP